jgi:hypothetical protein
MTRPEIRAYLNRMYFHMLSADVDGKDWDARQFVAVHMRQFPTKHDVPNETQEEVIKDGFQLT